MDCTLSSLTTWKALVSKTLELSEHARMGLLTNHSRFQYKKHNPLISSSLHQAKRNEVSEVLNLKKVSLNITTKIPGHILRKFILDQKKTCIYLKAPLPLMHFIVSQTTYNTATMLALFLFSSWHPRRLNIRNEVKSGINFQTRSQIQRRSNSIYQTILKHRITCIF